MVIFHSYICFPEGRIYKLDTSTRSNRSCRQYVANTNCDCPLEKWIRPTKIEMCILFVLCMNKCMYVYIYTHPCTHRLTRIYGGAWGWIECYRPTAFTQNVEYLKQHFKERDNYDQAWDAGVPIIGQIQCDKQERRCWWGKPNAPNHHWVLLNWVYHGKSLFI